MRFYAGVTDHDWFEHLRALPGIDEVNFWQPSPNSQFRALENKNRAKPTLCHLVQFCSFHFLPKLRFAPVVVLIVQWETRRSHIARKPIL